MENLGAFYYECGNHFFELEQYREAVINWIRAYMSGYGRDNILENIYNCFILPNEEEFRKNYENNSIDFTCLPYEQCTLDFIPVSDKEFFILDREEKNFYGNILLENGKLNGEKLLFHNILYTDIWDVREMLPDMKENSREVVYVLLNNLEAKFVSFLKLPDFRENYMSNFVLLLDEETMCAFFEEHTEVYLPRDLVSQDPDRYKKELMDIHEKRIHDIGKRRDNIFLSICIPTYNRGKLALRSVRHLLNLPYDSEIEIVVSNNGSDIETEEYDIIKNIPDARIQYHEFEENQFYTGNFLKLCELANGKYSMFASDEDMMFLENFGAYMDFIRQNSNCGVISSFVYNAYRWGEKRFFKKGVEAIAWMTGMVYITGFVFDMELCREKNAIEIVRKEIDESAVPSAVECVIVRKETESVAPIEDMIINDALPFWWFPHNFIAAVLCREKGAAVNVLPLWGQEQNVADRKAKFSLYYTPMARINNQNVFIDFCYRILKLDKKELVNMFLIKCQRTQHLLYMAYNAMPDDMARECGDEKEVHEWIYREHMKYLDAFPYELSEERYSDLKEKIGKLVDESYILTIDI